MKYFGIVLILFALISSCGTLPTDYDQWLVKKSDVEGVYKVNSDFVSLCNDQEKALISWYIYAYANECDSLVEISWKCGLLDALKVEDECSQEHRDFIDAVLGDDPIIQSKLQNCPVMPNDGAIQNLLQYIDIQRKSDTISFSMHVAGMNNTEEKYWDIEVEDVYLMEGKGLKKLN